MNRFIQPRHVSAALVFIASSLSVSAAKITVHVVGQVKEPGPHVLDSPIAPEELEKACGNWTEFGSAKRLQVIRLARPSCQTIDDPGEKSSQIFELADIPTKNGKYLLNSNDIIYIPAKMVYGR
jgi:hypothetical protein